MNNAIQLKAADAFASAHGYSASVVRLRNTSDVSIDYSVSGGDAVELAAGASAVIDVAGLTSEISVRRTDLSTTPVNVMLEFGLDPDEAYVLAVENAPGDITPVAAHNTAPDAHADIRTALAGKQDAGNYAGSSTPGGAATTALACTGNAATATTASACSGNSATATTASSCSGNAATATALQTARTINGVSFDGTANITVPAVDQTARDAAAAAQATANAAETPAGAQAKANAAQAAAEGTAATALSGHVAAADPHGDRAYSVQRANHTGSQAATTITEDTTHRFTTDTEKSTWNAKVSFPGFGTMAGTAAEGNDARLSDARTPLAHNQAWSTITSTPTTLSGYGITDAQGLDSDLTALAGLSTTGLVARTGSGTAATRTITGTDDQVTVTNGDGVSGNPTLSLPQSIAKTSTPQFAGVNLTGIQTVDTGTGELPTALGNTSLRMSRSDTQGARIEGVGFASAGITLSGRGAGGTRADPSGTTSDMLFLTVHGYDGTSWVAASKGSYRIGPDGTWSGTNNGTYHAWAGTPNESTTSADWMVLKSGKLGIGTTSPAAQLHLLSGEPYLKIESNGSSNGAHIELTPTTGYSASVGSTNACPLVLRTADADRVTIGTTGAVQFNNYGAGTLVTDSSGNVTASSDASLKTVTGSFTRGLDDVLKLTPRTYRWNEKSGMNTEDENVGFIAQEVLGAVPEAVGTMKTTDYEEDDAATGKKARKSKREAAEYLTLSDRPLIAALVNAVKELKAENDTLRARVSALENGKAAK